MGVHSLLDPLRFLTIPSDAASQRHDWRARRVSAVLYSNPAKSSREVQEKS